MHITNNCDIIDLQLRGRNCVLREGSFIMKKRALLALGLSVTLMFSNIVTVYAEEDTNGTGSSAEVLALEAAKNPDDSNSATVEEDENAAVLAVTQSTNNVGLAGTGDTQTEVTDNVSVKGTNSSGVETTDTATITVNGNVSAEGESCKGVVAADKSTTTVTGNVTAEGTGSYAVWAGGFGGKEGSTVNAGSVTANGSNSTGVYAENHAKVTVENDVKASEGTTSIPDESGYVHPVIGVSASGNANVTVKGNVEVNGAGTVGITVSNSGYITVGGDITASGDKYVWEDNGEEREVTGITAVGGLITVKGNVTSAGTGIIIERTDEMINSNVAVKGDVKGSSGIVMNTDSGVTVGGTVTATDGTGLTILLEEGESTGDVTLGTLSVEKDGETGILLDVNGMEYLQTIDDIIKAMPEINIFEINVKDNASYLWIDDRTENDTVSGTGISKEEAMNTILQQKVNYLLRTENTSNATISLDQDRALENTKITFHVKAADGYQVKGVSAGKAAVIDNGDGSYSVIVPKGGGVNISAIVETIIRDQQQNSGSSESSASDIEVVSAPTPTQYESEQKQVQQMIQNIVQGGNCVIKSAELISFNRATFEALAARPDVSVDVIYKWKGIKYKTTIPAGYPVLDLLNEDGYCGCLYLNAIFGSEVVE